MQANTLTSAWRTSALAHTFTQEHPANRILVRDWPDDGWLGAIAGSPEEFIVIRLDKPSSIGSIVVTNNLTGSLEVLGSRMDAKEERWEAVSNQILMMTPENSVAKEYGNVWRDLRLKPEAAMHTWEKLKFICSQPFNKDVAYGLSGITLKDVPFGREVHPDHNIVYLLAMLRVLMQNNGALLEQARRTCLEKFGVRIEPVFVKGQGPNAIMLFFGRRHVDAHNCIVELCRSELERQRDGETKRLKSLGIVGGGSMEIVYVDEDLIQHFGPALHEQNVENARRYPNITQIFTLPLAIFDQVTRSILRTEDRAWIVCGDIAEAANIAGDMILISGKTILVPKPLWEYLEEGERSFLRDIERLMRVLICSDEDTDFKDTCLVEVTIVGATIQVHDAATFLNAEIRRSYNTWPVDGYQRTGRPVPPIGGQVPAAGVPGSPPAQLPRVMPVRPVVPAPCVTLAERKPTVVSHGSPQTGQGQRPTSTSVPVAVPAPVMTVSVSIPRVHVRSFTKNGLQLLGEIEASSGVRIVDPGVGDEVTKTYRVQGVAESVNNAVDRIERELARLQLAVSPQPVQGGRTGAIFASGDHPASAGVGPSGSSNEKKHKKSTTSAGTVQSEQCIICEDAEAVSAFIPCGHRHFCHECAQRAFNAKKVCPSCRGVSVQVLRIFLT